MKAIICQEPGRLVMKNIPRPVPGPGEVLVRMRRVAICGSDFHAFKGEQPYFSYPRIMGHELSGEIAETAETAGSIGVGDPVLIIPYMQCGQCSACREGKTNCCDRLRLFGIHMDGGMQEFLSVPKDHIISCGTLDFDQLALVECLSIGAHAVERSQLRRGETALVIGAGPIGLGVMQFAHEAGARVIALDLNVRRLDFAQKHFKIDHIILNPKDPRNEIESITDGEYAPVVFDATGNPQSMMDAFKFISHGGRLILVGLAKDSICFDDAEFHKRETSLLSSRNATRQDMEHVIQSLETERVCASAMVTHRSNIDKVIEDFQYWSRPEAGVVKAVVEF